MVRRVKRKECNRLCKTSLGLLGWLVAWLGLDRSAHVLAERMTGRLTVLREAAYWCVSCYDPLVDSCFRESVCMRVTNDGGSGI